MIHDMVKLRNGNVMVDIGGTYAEVTQEVADYIIKLRELHKNFVESMDSSRAKRLIDIN